MLIGIFFFEGDEAEDRRVPDCEDRCVGGGATYWLGAEELTGRLNLVHSV